MKEKLLQFIWKNKLYGSVPQYTTNGKLVEILSPGMLNSDAGPDFFDAKIKIENLIWAGNIEIHLKASDWHRHGHHNDKAYNNTILHVVLDADKEILIDNRTIPQIQLNFPDYLLKNFTHLMQSDKWIACEDKILNISTFERSAWLNRLMIERLEYKTEAIYKVFEQTKMDWAETFYRLLTKNLGFKTNALPFELLANSLPFKILARHREQPKQIESLILGQAGLLATPKTSDEYYNELRLEYNFLSHKYKLQALDYSIWKWAKMRPSNFPTIRMIQLAQLICKTENLFSKLIEAESIEKLNSLFDIKIDSGYWYNHYQFEKESKEKTKSLGKQSLQLILINTIIPILFAYGKKNQNDELMQRALKFLETIKAEDNTIIRNFIKIGIKFENASNSQACIQLYNNYCIKQKCAACAIGQKLISKK
ncbi:MAG: DUF2851 family protein [Bacteroidales bacterium]|nr:DUF2851 family protein [Bacteroidales bacterium]